MLVTQRQGQRQGLGREGALGLKAQEVIRRPPRSRYVWVKEGEEIDWERLRKLLPEPGFKVLPRRWVVERTFSWIDQNRRMSKDYDERLPQSSEAFVYLAMVPPDGEAFGPLLSLFGWFLTAVFILLDQYFVGGS